MRQAAQALADFRHGWRLLHRQPAFSAAAILTLAVGVGAAAAVFSLVRAVLLRDLPFDQPERLAWMYNARTERDRAPFSIPDLNDYRRDNATLSGLAPFTNWTANLTGNGEAERLEGTRVAGDFFALLGCRAALGRTLEPRDEASHERVVVLTHGLWRRRFGGGPDVIGSRIMLNGAPFVVVGVMPPDFLFPFRDAELAVPLPLRDDPRRSDRGANFLRVVARLRPGVTFARAKSDLEGIAHRLQRAYPADDARKTGVNLYPLHDEIVSDYRRILLTLLGAVVVLLAIGCGNLANLLLVRAVGRRAELGVRMSLGASPRRITNQLVAEAAALAIAGTAAGVVVARLAIAGWRIAGPQNFPRLGQVAIDYQVVMFAGAACVAVILICGLVPGWLIARDLVSAMASETRSLTAGRREGLVRRGFVGVQVAGTVVLLVCMGLVARGFARLQRVDPGFTPGPAMAMQLSLPPTRYATRTAIVTLYASLKERIVALNGVSEVGAVSLMPLTGLLSAMDIVLPDRPAPPLDEVPQAHFRIASAGYFEAAGIAIVDGRAFDEHDDANGRPVTIISRTLAERHWRGQRAVGRFVQLALSPDSPKLEIVGVANDVKQFTIDGAPTADLYVPLAQMPAGQAAGVAARMYWIVRAGADPERLMPAIRGAVRSVDSEIAASSTRTLDQIVALSLGSRRANVRLLEVFGQVAMALAALGVYGIAAFSVAMRQRELAVRWAFGASRAELVGLVAAAELRPVMLGITAGLLLALAVARLLGPDVLFSVSATDWMTYAVVAAALLIVAAAAVCLPAVRAGRSSPADLLRV